MHEGLDKFLLSSFYNRNESGTGILISEHDTCHTRDDARTSDDLITEIFSHCHHSALICPVFYNTKIRTAEKFIQLFLAGDGMT
ncbi:MAG: hypothetical protein ACD_78C00310G0003 [uncultured bacterium (gcode 4)]|uniref:Uncharacterized protein n=1 Tax=uncultured bacterium (gcode 4) TaxID=1234023 RepID=K1XHC4_9BACT|nr:MAG: hypothetical protein ACD_78C00310G0003 [uncultured bacterium (gcode 4)]